MGIVEGFLRLLGASPSVPAPEPVPTTPMRESGGATLAAEDAGWRKLTGAGPKDLAPMSQQRMQALATRAWESNPLGNRLIELPMVYMLGKGVKLRINDPDLQQVLDRHWKDGINSWPIKLPKRLRELALFGEQCWPVFVGGNGFVRIGYLDPSSIETVVMDPDNAEQPIIVVTKKNARGVAKRFRVIVNVDEDAFSESTQQIRATGFDGDCFFFRVNDLCNGTRGRSDLLTQLDWLQAYDEFLFGELDRADHLRAFIWDVLWKGATQEQIDARVKSMGGPPKPGSVRLHNESEEWKAQSPSLQAGDTTLAARLFRNHITGGATMPEHWYGGGGDVNRSTAQSMDEPTRKVYEQRQALVGHLLMEVGRFVIRSHWIAMAGKWDDANDELLDTLVVEWPEMTSRDSARYATAFGQIVSAVTLAVKEGFLSRKTALMLIAVAAAELGIEIDVEEELAAAEAELAERGGKDLFGEDLDTSDPDKVDDPDADDDAAK